VKNRTKLLLGTSLVLLLVLPFIVTTVVNASGQEINNSNTGAVKGIAGWLHMARQKFGRYGSVEVSEEFKTKVLTITSSDTDVQGLLNDGYSITRVIPIIKSVVDANGDVTSKVTTAIVILKNENTKNFATVWVDLNTESVTKIVTLVRTVITKS
jgi:hypothetical protein